MVPISGLIKIEGSEEAGEFACYAYHAFSNAFYHAYHFLSDKRPEDKQEVGAQLLRAATFMLKFKATLPQRSERLVITRPTNVVGAIVSQSISAYYLLAERLEKLSIRQKVLSVSLPTSLESIAFTWKAFVGVDHMLDFAIMHMAIPIEVFPELHEAVGELGYDRWETALVEPNFEETFGFPLLDPDGEEMAECNRLFSGLYALLAEAEAR